MAIDQSLKTKRGRPAGAGSPAAKSMSKMEQKMALVYQRLALLDSESDKDADVVPIVKLDEDLATVVDQQPTIINCDNTDSEEEYVPLRIVRPGRGDSAQKRLPCLSQTHDDHNINTATNKRERPASSQSAKSNKEQKKTLVKPKIALIESVSTNSSASDKDDHLVPMVSGVNGEKTFASVQGNCGSAMERAKELQGKLPAEHPSFIKHMLQSHVIQGFWLGLPCDFCNKYLPKHDTAIVLEDEDGRNYDTKYLGTKQGLSAGWRGFAINHGIKVGDVVVFQLVSSTKFKVYILRATNFSTTDGALGLLCLDAGKEKMPKQGSSNGVQSKEEPKLTRVSSKVIHSDGSNLVSESIDGIQFSESDIDFDNVASFSNFSIIVDSLVIDCKFPNHLRKTYYELCRAQKSFLHKNLLKQINLTLAVGVIMETINIAEGIRACKAHTSSREDFVIWKKTLESFELLGMNVAFLLKRMDQLLGLPDRSRDLVECKEYKEIKLEQAQAKEKIQDLESKMLNLKDTLKNMDVEMEEMESSAKRRDEMVQRLATAPW
ncbi:B3 domain-containing protein Os01g0234100 isoform X2 [Brachypodium distachyon]|uniref:TF-B3 domain-containing protein n=1 Tax=Brachypodium distachyon TaxID=15368 RepID=A0A0Q3IC21_BRADI|nr:B3 domain-containing protein Os01g0234100 isoform X2 [Brachypodium distachyon]KQK03459.1 hypothetical protein BRADI_2g07980v3 [Brachypodium distachyon]|eukprot:XP_014754264.1 B3 domain-containing protein Os01g0234100 isoform X2 [Brachypodium distachyon]